MRKTPATIYAQQQRVSDMLWRRTTRKAAEADPETGGNMMLVNNWGNEAANAVWSAHWERSDRISKIADRLYNEAEHERHEREWRVKPLWCALCHA